MSEATASISGQAKPKGSMKITRKALRAATELDRHLADGLTGAVSLLAPAESPLVRR